MNMGEGKTLTALETANRAGVKSVVVYCPAYLKKNWEREVEKFYGDKFCDISFHSYASRNKKPKAEMVIMDEFHYLKNFKAQRTDKVFSYLKENRPKLMMGLSGTPMKNSALDFFPYLTMLGVRHQINFPKNPYAFEKTFCRQVPNDFTPSGYSYEGVKDETKTALKKLLSPFFYFTPKELRPILPETMDKHYGDTKKKSEIAVLMQEAIESGDNIHFMSLKAMNAECNVKDTIRLANDLIDQKKRPVIFTEHRNPAKELASKFGVSPIIGGVSNEKRNNILDNFDNGRSPVIVGTFGAMGMGLNITSSDTMIFNDYSFSPSDYDQARKRIHRKGQNSTCFYHHIFSSELDKQIFYKMIRKKGVSDEMHQR